MVEMNPAGDVTPEMAAVAKPSPEASPAPSPEAPPKQDTGADLNNQKPGQLPLIYSAAAQARVAGYSWNEINDKFAGARQAATSAGYSDADVDKAFGLQTGREAPPPGLEQVHARPDTADTLRAFSEKYLTPEANDGAAPQIHSAGDFAKQLGWDILDVGKILGGGVVNGIAAITEGLDGKPRSQADQVRLGIEAQGFLGLLASPDLAAPGAKGTAALRGKLPTIQDTVDAAAAVAKHTPEGITPETLTSAAQTLGKNFVDTGEHPLQAAARAVENPEVMQGFHEAMGGNTVRLYHGGSNATSGGGRFVTPHKAYAEGYAVKNGGEVWATDVARDHPEVVANTDYNAVEGTTTPAPLMHFEASPELSATLRPLRELEGTKTIPPAAPAPDTLLDAAQHAEVSAEAVKQPGFIPDPPARPALEPVPHNDALDPLNRMATEGQTTDANLGGNPFAGAARPQMDINPETIGVRNGALGDGLVTSFKRIFDIQSLDREGAGVLRSRLASTQADLIRSTENLRRFGRAVNDLSSVDRRTWWDAYEAGSLAPYTGTPLEAMGLELRGELDRAYTKMNGLGIAPGYVDNYLPRLYQNPKAAQSFFGKRPLEGSKTFTRERVFASMREAEAHGMQLATDNPVEATLIRLHDMNRYINAHGIMEELTARNLGHRIAPGSAIPAGFTRITSRIGDTAAGNFYAPDPVARMMNRYLSPSLNGEPIYDVLRSASSMFTTVKLALSMFHPLYLSWSAGAQAIGLGMKQMLRGGTSNLFEGAFNVLKAPIAPLEDFWQGKKVIDYAQTGHGDPRIATVYDAMIQAGARFGRTETYQSSTAGSFWAAIHGSLSPASGLTTLPQELAGMFRNTPDLMIGNTKVAPGYLRAMAVMVPRVLDTLSEPIMGKLVPYMKAGALSRMIQEEMAAHPGMGVEDIRRVGGRFSDIVDNRIGEAIQDNMFWPTILHNLNNAVFMAPQWFMGKIRLFTGAANDLFTEGGFPKGADGQRALSDNISYLVGGIGYTMFASALYGYLKGTWKPDWTMRDYMAPPTAGTDKQGGDERIMLPSLWRDAYGWATDPKQELTNKVNGLWSTLAELATNKQFNGAAITDPKASWAEAGGDYAKFLALQLEPMAWSQRPLEETHIDAITRILGAREAPFGIREPDLAEKYENKEVRSKVRKKARMDAASE